MKEIKAYIRTCCLDQTVKSLHDNGAPGVAIVSVHPVGYDFGTRFRLREQDISKKYFDISKIELVCDDEDMEKFTDIILDSAHTGATGDGLIFVSDINVAIKIRTHKRSEKISLLFD